MYIKLDYFNFSSFDLEVKVTQILKYILFLTIQFIVSHLFALGLNFKLFYLTHR